MNRLANWRILALPVLLFLGSLTPGNGQDDGVAAEWDLATDLETIGRQTERLGEMLQQVDPGSWAAQDPSDEEASRVRTQYSKQLALVQEQVMGITYAIDKLKEDPERLSVTLELFFRLDYLSRDIGRSFSGGVARYQNPALASLLDSVLDEAFSRRERVRKHLQDLVAIKETELGVMDKEAQRCREIILRRPASSRTAR